MSKVIRGIGSGPLCTFIVDFRKLLTPEEEAAFERRMAEAVDTTLQYKAPEVYDDCAWRLAHECVSSLGIAEGERLEAMRRLWKSALAADVETDLADPN